jgi:hypothetical protein
MIDSIYYTEKLVPIGVKLLKKEPPYAVIETLKGKRYQVLLTRVIPATVLLDPKRFRSLRCEKPADYLSVVEYCLKHNICPDDVSRHRLSNFCRWASKRQGIESWRSTKNVTYFSPIVLDCAYERMLSKSNDES